MTAAVMFFFFAVSFTWILINVLLTIIIEAFEKVKQELSAKGNQYEILDFLKTHGRYVLGTKELPPRDCALADDDTDKRKRELEDDDDSEESDEEYDQNAAHLPEKVDEFLDFINNMYFDGEMDTKKKGILSQDSSGHLAPRIIYSSDNETGTSPKISRKFD